MGVLGPEPKLFVQKIIPATDPNSSILNHTGVSAELCVELSVELSVEL